MWSILVQEMLQNLPNWQFFLFVSYSELEKCNCSLEIFM